MSAAVARFWNRTETEPNTGCTLWLGPRARRGYGITRWNGKTRQAHRIAYELGIGPIPRGLCVLHRCDTPPCVNPAHLFVGTQQDNVADRDAKGRTARGERCAHPHHGEQNGRAILTWERVRMIRDEYVAGVGCAALMARHRLPRSTVNEIISGRHWPDAAWSATREAMRRALNGRHPRARLSHEQVAAIRSRRARGESYSAIARAFSVTTGTIAHILTGRTWKETA